jgi:hypothetical protein
MYGKNKPYQNSEPLPVVDKLPNVEPPNVTVTMIILYTFFLAVIIFIYLNRDAIYDTLKKYYDNFKPIKQIDELEDKYHRLFKQYNDSSMNNQKKIDEVLEKEKNRINSLEENGKNRIKLLEENGKKRMDTIEEQGKKRMDTLEEREKRLIELLEKNQTCNSLEKKEKEMKENEKKEEKGAIKQLDQRLDKYTKEQIVTSDGFCYIGYDNNQRECTTVSNGDICMSGQVFPSLDVCLYPRFRH